MRSTIVEYHRTDDTLNNLFYNDLYKKFFVHFLLLLFFCWRCLPALDRFFFGPFGHCLTKWPNSWHHQHCISARTSRIVCSAWTFVCSCIFEVFATRLLFLKLNIGRLSACSMACLLRISWISDITSLSKIIILSISQFE